MKIRLIATTLVSAAALVGLATAPAQASELDQVSRATANEIVEDLDTAVAAVDEFWRTNWDEHFPGEYESPTVLGLYDGTSAHSPTCADEALTEFNAFYCFPEDFVAWDESLIAAGFEQVGDSWAYLVVAHEWGHAIQNRIPAARVAEQAELQADCLAGAALYGAVDDGHLAFEQGDMAELAAGLAYLGDEMPWTDSHSHGDSFERVEAFNIGRTGGVTGCLA